MSTVTTKGDGKSPSKPFNGTPKVNGNKPKPIGEKIPAQVSGTPVVGKS